MAGGQNYDGQIETPNDDDYFYFNVAGQRQIDITLTRPDAGTCSVSASLYDQAGNARITSASIGSSVVTDHILRSIPYSSQYVVRVDGSTGCHYRVNVSPADALTTQSPGVVAHLEPSEYAGADDVERLFVDGVLRGQTQGPQTQTVELGDLPATSQITLEALNGSGGYSWSFRVVDVQGRGQTTLLTESASGRTEAVGVVRRVTISRSGAILGSCGEELAPVSCIPPPPVDQDRDGYVVGADCEDGNAGVNPGAKEVRGNQIDENCDGQALPYLRSSGTVKLISRRPRRGRTEVRSLVVRNTNRAYTVQVRCSGAGCRSAVRSRRFRARPSSRTLSLTRYVRGMKLRSGAKLSVKIFRSGYQSKTYTFRAYRTSGMRRTLRCSNPNSNASFVC